MALAAPGAIAMARDRTDATVRARQWALAALDVPSAWHFTHGEGVLVAVLDTGVDPRHPDLAETVTVGPDFTSEIGADDRGRHGTSMASLIAGHGHGPERAEGVLGVAPAARILSIRVTREVGGVPHRKGRGRDAGALARGIRYAADSGADVISMSLGGGTWKGSAAERAAVRYAVRRGAVLVASAGNNGDTGNREVFPAAYPEVIAVGAVDPHLRLTSFSNRQPYLSVVAPGVRIIAADGADSYVVMDGTSSAAALVAGVAALIKAAFPTLSPSQVRRAIEGGAVPMPLRRAGYGHGVANAALALRFAARLADSSPQTGAKARARRLTGTSSADAFGVTRYDGPRWLIVGILLLFTVSKATGMIARRLRPRSSRTYPPPPGKAPVIIVPAVRRRRVKSTPPAAPWWKAVPGQ